MQSINGFHFDDTFCHFINTELLPACASRSEFWDEFTQLLRTATTDSHTARAVKHSHLSLGNPRYALKAINARWGSLYSALYHETTIPHSTGLKTGQRFNVARASRVIDYAREFLDAAFPLSEGSHKDAVSYLVYFQQLMVTLADGSTVGLKNTRHYVAKAGPRDDPESIFLRTDEVHVELRFDRSGAIGTIDMANIEDILIEAPARTILGCAADTVTEKCEVLRNLQQLASGTLKVNFHRGDKTQTRRLNRNTDVTARNGEAYTVITRNPVAIQLHGDAACPAVSDSHDNALPAAIVDAALFSMIIHNGNEKNIALMVASHQTEDLVNPVLTLLNSKRTVGEPIELLRNYQHGSTDQPQPADTRAQQIPWVRLAEEELKNTPTIAQQNTAVLRAIEHSKAPVMLTRVAR